MKLLSVDNTKLLKSEIVGYFSVGLHLAPHLLSGYNTCKFSSFSCVKSCLNLSGMSSMSKIQQGRINKTKLFFENKDWFLNQLNIEIQYYNMVAKNEGKQLSVRLNLTSDIDWQLELINGKSLMELNPFVQMYDYTKNYNKISKFGNYDLTYSYDAINHKKAIKVLERGDRLAVVFDKANVNNWNGFECVDGDKHDMTFLQPKDKILALKYKNICTKGFNNKENKLKSTLVVNV
jgi:predicted secreted protein